MIGLKSHHTHDLAERNLRKSFDVSLMVICNNGNLWNIASKSDTRVVSVLFGSLVLEKGPEPGCYGKP